MPKKDIEKSLEILKDEKIIDSVVNKLTVGLFLTDNKTRIIWANKTFQGWFGSLKSLIGKPAKSLIHAKKGMECSCIKVLKTKKIETGYGYGTMPKTRDIFFESVSTPIFNSKGRIKSIMGQIADITERSQAEKNLQETTDYLESLFNYANAPIIVWDKNFRITQFNHAFERLTGKTVEEVAGKHLNILFPDDRRKEAMEYIRRTVAGERWEVVEIPIQHTSGTVNLVLWNSANIYAKDGKTVIATIAHGQDITERKQAEALLKESESKYKELVENANSLILKLDTKGRIIFLNEFAEKFFGYKKEEIIGKDIVGTIMPERLKHMARTVCLNPQKYPKHEHFNMTKDGKEIFISWTSKPLYEEGKYIGVIRIGCDLTEKKKAETALQKSEAKFRELYEGSQDAYVRIDMNHRIMEFNSAFLKMLGYSKKELLDKNYIESLAPKKWHPIEEKIFKTHVIKRGYSELYEKELIRKDGAIFPAQMRAYLIKDEEGNPAGMWGFIRDISNVKKSEEKVRNLTKELENRVRIRTKELNAANKELKARVNELERFHDFVVGRELKMIELKKKIQKLEKAKKERSPF